jgi:hypothetical protein
MDISSLDNLVHQSNRFEIENKSVRMKDMPICAGHGSARSATAQKQPGLAMSMCRTAFGA